MEKTIYSCDKCEKEVDQADLFNLQISVSKSGYSRKTKNMAVCQDCALKVGLLKLDKEEQKPSISPADELYKIVEDMVSNMVQESY